MLQMRVPFLLLLDHGDLIDNISNPNHVHLLARGYLGVCFSLMSYSHDSKSSKPRSCDIEKDDLMEETCHGLVTK